MLENQIRSRRRTTNLVSVSEQILQVHAGVQLHLFEIHDLFHFSDDYPSPAMASHMYDHPHYPHGPIRVALYLIHNLMIPVFEDPLHLVSCST